jgi:hypothetical protein
VSDGIVDVPTLWERWWVVRITVTINGGPINIWNQHQLQANPFPQIPRAEYGTANRMLRELDSDPITDVSEIRNILDGCDKEFIDLCCRLFIYGERIRFDVEWPEDV